MVRHLFLVFAALCAATPAFAQGAGNLLIEKMTSYEIRDAIAAGKTTAILPSGGTEQNGPNMAVGKHNFRAAANALTIARRLGKCAGGAGDRLCPRGQLRSADGASALSRHIGRAGTGL